MLFWGLVSTCGEEHYYRQSVTFPENQWALADTIDFAMDITDTTAKYDIMLDILHEPDYAYQNIYIKILTKFPDGETLEQTLSVDLADSKGQWYGECNRNSCNVRIVLQKQAIFDRIGGHLFKIIPYMRSDTVRGIQGVSMLLDQNQGPN